MSQKNPTSRIVAYCMLVMIVFLIVVVADSLMVKCDSGSIKSVVLVLFVVMAVAG